MPVKRQKGETEQDFISRCMSEIKSEFPDNAQRFAVCKSYSDKFAKENKDEIFVLTPRKNENRGMYLKRCSSNSKIKSQFISLKERSSFCLSSFNEYYKYWSKIEMGMIPEDSAIGECIAQQKSKGYTYSEAYAHCSSKVGNKPLGAGESINLGNDLLVEPVEFSEAHLKCVENHIIAGFPEDKSKEFCKNRLINKV